MVLPPSWEKVARKQRCADNLHPVGEFLHARGFGALCRTVLPNPTYHGLGVSITVLRMNKAPESGRFSQYTETKFDESRISGEKSEPDGKPYSAISLTTAIVGWHNRFFGAD